MIVVADTTPLNYLILLDRIDVLQNFYGRIFIPLAVQEELLSSFAPAKVRAWAGKPPLWLNILSPYLDLRLLPIGLDAGETQAIAAAENMHAEWLLIDEAAGRDEAARRGLRTIGTLGILRKARGAGLLNLPAELDRLIQLGFRISQPLMQLLLESI